MADENKVDTNWKNAPFKEFHLRGLNWVTNHPFPIEGFWPRRAGVEYVVGPPKGTEALTPEALTQMDIIGIYVDMPLDEYWKLEIIKKP